jgi:hypothetical protein
MTDTPKIYVDTNLISRLSDLMMGSDELQITDEQADAILAVCNCEVEFVTSKKMLDEVVLSKNLKQRALLTLLASLAAKVPYKDISFFTSAMLGAAPLGAATLGGGYNREDPMMVELQAIFDANDSEHIFQAIRSDCSYFLTLDRRTIIDKAKNNSEVVQRLCPDLDFVDPEELQTLLDCK